MNKQKQLYIKTPYERPNGYRKLNELKELEKALLKRAVYYKSTAMKQKDIITMRDDCIDIIYETIKNVSGYDKELFMDTLDNYLSEFGDKGFSFSKLIILMELGNETEMNVFDTISNNLITILGDLVKTTLELEINSSCENNWDIKYNKKNFIRFWKLINNKLFDN